MSIFSIVTDNFYGMGKEVENLIMENNELLATKYESLFSKFNSYLPKITKISLKERVEYC